MEPLELSEEVEEIALEGVHLALARVFGPDSLDRSMVNGRMVAVVFHNLGQRLTLYVESY